jgi:hypothetical protein
MHNIYRFSVSLPGIPILWEKGELINNPSTPERRIIFRTRK